MKFLKQSQIKMFETIAILFVFFILLMFGFIFYTRIQKSTYKVEEEETTILKAIQIAERASFLPEIICNPDIALDCIDLYKLEAFSNIINLNDVFYYDILGHSKITIKQLYPDTYVWEIYDKPKKQDSGKIQTQIPISIYNLVTEEYTFGVLYVDAYK